MPRSLYDVLQSHPLASNAELCAAWQRLADPLEREGGAASSSASRLNELNAAWAVLGNPASRAAYDDTLPADAFIAPLPDTAALRPLIDWRIGRLIILIAGLSLLAFTWSSCRIRAYESAARAQAQAYEAQARMREAEMRAETGPGGGDRDRDTREETWRRDAQAREFEEARRRSDESMAEREAAAERRDEEARRMRAEHEHDREQVSDDAE